MRIEDHRAGFDFVSPPPSPLREPKAARPRRRRRVIAAAAILAGAVLSSVAIESVRHPGALAAILPDIDVVAGALGFGIDQVSLAGHRFTFDRDVFDALDLANVRSIAALDAEAVKARIERLPWIATAELTRVYPGRLDVRVTERTPFAVWTRGETAYLIDATGRVLTPVGPTNLPDLPRVSGEGAATEARALLALVARYPDIARRLTEAERVGERRWTLKLSGGTSLVLPVDREADVLEAIAAEPDLGRLVAGPNAVIDFRKPGRVTVRAGEAADKSPAAKAGT